MRSTEKLRITKIIYVDISNTTVGKEPHEMNFNGSYNLLLRYLTEDAVNHVVGPWAAQCVV